MRNNYHTNILNSRIKAVFLILSVLVMVAAFAPTRIYAAKQDYILLTYEYDKEDYPRAVMQTKENLRSQHYDVRIDDSIINIADPSQTEIAIPYTDSYGLQGSIVYTFAGWKLRINNRDIQDELWIIRGGKSIIDTDKFRSELYVGSSLIHTANINLIGKWDVSISPPAEYSKTLHVKFVDQNGNILSGGSYTDGLMTNNSGAYVRRTYHWLFDKKEMRVNEGFGGMVRNPASSTLNSYETDCPYNMNKYRSVKLIADGAFTTAYEIIEYENTQMTIDFTETARPDGYKLLEGGIRASFNLNNNTISIDKDLTGRAYISGNTLYIVHERQTYDVRYEVGNGSEELISYLPQTESVYEYDLYTPKLLEKSPIRIGNKLYYFEYWEKDGIAVTDSFKVTAQVVLSAVWKVVEIKDPLDEAKIKAIEALGSIDISSFPESDRNRIKEIIEAAKAAIDKAGTEGEIKEILKKANDDIKKISGRDLVIYTGEQEGEIIPLSYVEEIIESTGNDIDIVGSSYAPLKLMSKKQTKKSITLKWNKVAGAENYIIYGCECGGKYTRLASVSGKSYKVKRIAGKKLKNKRYYKFVAVAERQGSAISVSKTVHIKSGGRKENVSEVKTNNKSVSMQQGSSFKIKASALPKSNHIKMRYESSDTNVAKVNSKGKVRAMGMGEAKIYCYAENGVCRAVNISVIN